MSTKNLNPPYFNKLIFSIILFCVVSWCEIIWKNIPNSFISKSGYVLFPLEFIIFIYFGYKFIKKQHLDQLSTNSHKRRVRIYLMILAGCLIYGLVRGNSLNFILHETILLVSLGFILILGLDDGFCDILIKTTTILFWIALISSLLTLKIHSYSADLAPWESTEGIDHRYTDSMAYGWHGLTYLGLPLFLYGWTAGKTLWNRFQILGLAGYSILNVGIFMFRGAALFVCMILVVALLMPSTTFRKVFLIILINLGLLFSVFWIDTNQGQVFIERLNSLNNSGLLATRLPETSRYFEQMGPEWLWGRGLGGSYDLGGLFGLRQSSIDSNWQVVHIGWLIFTLKGGIPLIIVVLSFFVSWFKKRSYQWKKNPINITALYWVPLSFIDWLLNPIILSASDSVVYGVTFMFLARFGLRKKV